MPFLSWNEGKQVQRHSLDEDCVLGRDPQACGAANPIDASVSRRHASIARFQDGWWIRDLGSRNGTTLNGLPLNQPQGNALEDGDAIRLGDWELRFTLGYPGLDPERFLERVGDIFTEVRIEPRQALRLVRGLELLQRSSEALLQETEAEAMIRSLLTEALKLLGAERGFVVFAEPDRTLRSVHRVGDVQDVFGLSRSVIEYVLLHHTGVASNEPLNDPRFGGQSLVELGRGPLMCAPLGGPGEAPGALYVDRAVHDRPFTRFDLALFLSFVRQSSIAIRHAQLSQKALGRAELEGELARARGFHGQAQTRRSELLEALRGPLRWARRLAADLPEGGLVGHQLAQLSGLLDAGLQEGGGGDSLSDEGSGESLSVLQARLAADWAPLLRAAGAELLVQEAPAGSLWLAHATGALALQSMVEPLLVQVVAGAQVRMTWERDRGGWALTLAIPGAVESPLPGAWTSRALRDCGIQWHWVDQVLTLIFQEASFTPEEEGGGLLGLVADGSELAEMFQAVAEAQGLGLNALAEEPPTPPVRPHRYLVLDARRLKDAVECTRAYRRHPAFATTPILVIRASDDQTPDLLAAGATDWLPVGFRWESLHNRMQVLRGHEELQKKALAAERLDSFGQMAGTLKHEINNPLAVISMQVEMLERKYPDEPRLAKINDMVDRIQGLLQVLQKMREATPEAYADGSQILKLS